MREFRRGQRDAARQIIDKLDGEPSLASDLNSNAHFYLNVWRAHLALDAGWDAGNLVATLDPQSPDQRIDAFEVWARHLVTQGQATSATHALMLAKEQAATIDPSREGRLTAMLWEIATTTPLQQTAAHELEGEDLRLWWDIATRFKQSMSSASWIATLQDWTSQNPNHESVSWLARMYRTGQDSPHHIAVLLPQSGNDAYSQAARAIRDGWMLAYLADSERSQSTTLPTFEFVDTVGKDTAELVETAFANGASAIVGPLRKDAVTDVYLGGEYPGPVLMLNTPHFSRAAQPRSKRFLAYSIEDEAQELARTLSRKQDVRCVLIYGDAPWMIRARSEFEQNVEAPVRVVAVRRIGEFAQLTDVIGASLGIAESAQRHETIQSIVNFPLEFQPRMNQEINSVVAFIDSSQLEAVLESVRFHATRPLDIYVTDSAVRGGVPALAEGVRFTTDAWRIYDSPLHEQVVEHFDSNPNMTTLYAMGVDAYRFSNQWSYMNVNQTIAGSAGRYRLEPSGNIRRLPYWGVVSNLALTPNITQSATNEKIPFL